MSGQQNNCGAAQQEEESVTRISPPLSFVELRHPPEIPSFLVQLYPHYFITQTLNVTLQTHIVDNLLNKLSFFKYEEKRQRHIIL